MTGNSNSQSIRSLCWPRLRLLSVLSVQSSTLYPRRLVRPLIANRHKQFARQAGFSLMELLLVMVFIALLAALVMPVATNSVSRAKEAALKENLFVMRKALDDYYADHGNHPGSLSKLSELRYIRQIPVDPLTERSDTWVEIRNQGVAGDDGIIDVRSGSDQKSTDEGYYRDW